MSNPNEMRPAIDDQPLDTADRVEAMTQAQAQVDPDPADDDDAIDIAAQQAAGIGREAPDNP